jgi:hypothetical protein
MDSRFRIQYIDMIIYHIDVVILDNDMGYGLMILEMTVSMWDILLLCIARHVAGCLLIPQTRVRHACLGSMMWRAISAGPYRRRFRPASDVVRPFAILGVWIAVYTAHHFPIFIIGVHVFESCSWQEGH